jgi:predicted lysophospholipase L1 biosynthesis ABC-type transport system permease subunit
MARTARTPAPAAMTVLILTLALTTADLAVALHRTSGKEGAAAAAANAVYQISNISGTTRFVTPAVFGSDALVTSTATYLTVLAIVAVAAGCLVVALGTAVEARERRTIIARLTTMGLTAGQARAVAAVELLGPIALAAIGGTAAAPLLLWAVRPALSGALGGADAQISGVTLALPLAAVTVLALASGLAATGAARRGVAGTLRLGDAAEGA